MSSRPLDWTVALDGGTTRTRARLVRGEVVVATASRAVGARDVAIAGAAPGLAAAARDAIAEACRAGGLGRPDRIVASGMLTSEVGLAAVPHVAAPAGLDDLARGAARIELAGVADQPILFVPGVRTPPGPGPDGWAEADVMRGEECETLGAWTPDAAGPAGSSLFLWPGSHTKLVAVDGEGRIVASTSTLAGELIAAVMRHTVLAASLPESPPEAPDLAWADDGARLARRDGLARAAFLVRLAALGRPGAPDQRASFWLGAVIARDVDHLVAHRLMATADPPPVHVGGRPALRTLYARYLRDRYSGLVVVLDREDAAALGAVRVARRAEEISDCGLRISDCGGADP